MFWLNQKRLILHNISGWFKHRSLTQECSSFFFPDEQQVKIDLDLPNKWKHLKVKLTHNDSINFFFVMLHAMLNLKMSALVLLKLFLMPLWQRQVVKNLQTSSVRNFEKGMGNTNRLKKDPLRKRKKPILRKKNDFQEYRRKQNEVLQLTNVGAFCSWMQWAKR